MPVVIGIYIYGNFGAGRTSGAQGEADRLLSAAVQAALPRRRVGIYNNTAPGTARWAAVGTAAGPRRALAQAGAAAAAAAVATHGATTAAQACPARDPGARGMRPCAPEPRVGTPHWGATRFAHSPPAPTL